MKLIEVCDFIVDCPHSTANDEGEGYPLIRTPNVGSGRLILEGVHRVSEDVYNSRIQRGVPEKDDIILAREAPAGNVAIINNEGKVCLGQRTVLIRPNRNKVVPQFLVYYLLAPEQQHKLKSSANGATVAHINMPKIRGLEISVPFIKTQQRIASILSAYDDLIENNQKQIKMLEEAAQRLYKEWFVDLRFPGHESVKIVDGVPEGWKKINIGSLLAVVKRTKQVKTSDMLEKGAIPVIDQSKKFIAGYTDDYETLINTDLPAIVFGDHTRVLKYVQFPFAKGADGTQIIISNNEKMPQVLFYCGLINIDLSNYSYARHFKYLKEQIILVPTESVAVNFSNIANKWYMQIEKLRQKTVLLQEARDRLLPKLMSGEIEV